ncbi:hypothetical protein GIB67_013955 [Kingdonia uniflora]|uniref:Cytochrome P450 n=1 Tax=Kingdonia uniflora TaxID=39325 RepID=A0A7J7LDP0_9MAGN|nr:hypothetical protein GIB67_013955 [Kingdonia uniflora]
MGAAKAKRSKNGKVEAVLEYTPIGNKAWYFKNKSQALTHWPFLGTLPSLLWYSKRWPERSTEIYFSIGCGSFILNGPVFSKLRYLVTCHCQNLEYILKTNFSNFPKGPDFGEVFDILGVGILNVDGSSWRLQRRMGHTVLSTSEFRNLVAKESRKMVNDQLVPFLTHVAREGTLIDL